MGMLYPRLALPSQDLSLRVLVKSPRPSSSWLVDVLGWRPMVRQVVRDAWEVLEALAEGWFDLVVADVGSAGAQGLQLAAMARAAGEHTPFLLVAERLDDRLIAQAARLEDVALVARPRSLGSLLGLRRTMRRAGGK